MAARPVFRILDLVVAVAAVGVGVGGGLGIDAADREDIASIAFWLVFAGVALVGYLAARFARTREVRLIVVGIALAFAAAADGMYEAMFVGRPGASAVGAIGLGGVAVVMVLGGVAHGLMIRWHELKHDPAPSPAPERTSSS